MTKKIKSPKLLIKLLILALCLTLLLALAACGNGQTNENGEPSNNGADITDPDDDQAIDKVSQTVKDMVFQVVEKELWWADNIYFSGDEPDDPEYEDVLISNIRYQDHASFEESMAAVFLVDLYIYYEEISWGDYIPFLVIIERTAGNDGWLAVLGMTYDFASGKSTEAIILEAVYDLWDIDVAIRFDYNTEYIGPGSSSLFLDEEVGLECHFDYEPIYNDGDYWLSYHFDGMSALVYHNESEGYERTNLLEITRADCVTYRDIRVGSSREEVLAAYPEISDRPYWSYEGDYLWYNRSLGDYLEGFGVSILFWFTDNMVSKIDLINMFD